MAFYDPTMVEVRVLLVDEDVNTLNETRRLLQFNSYKVTMVEYVSVASSMLLKGKITFDVVMIDITLPNVGGYVLMHHAVAMGIPVILMSNNASPTLVKCAIEDGAFLFMEKPVTAADLKYVWQHILREKIRKFKQISAAAAAPAPAPLIMHNNNMHFFQEGNSCRNQILDLVEKNNIDDDLSILEINDINNVSDSYISRTELWTPHLHGKFVSAVTQLGEGRCFPESILQLMNVPGLTKLQVASHLQKCRLNWKSGRWRKYDQCLKARKPCGPTTLQPRRQRSRPKEYGALPNFVINQNPRVATVDVMENPTSPPSIGTPNMGSGQGTSTASNNIVEDSGGVVPAAGGQNLQFDTFLDILFNDDDDIIANNSAHFNDLH